MAQAARPTGVLFVCMGNICRSPTAEGVFRKLQREQAPQLSLRLESAGTHAYHVGEPPDERAILTAQAHGIDISQHRGRVVTRADFAAFDYILAMDRTNLARLQQQRPRAARARLHLLLEFAGTDVSDEVPDPYYGGVDGFERVLQLITRGAAGLLQALRDAESQTLPRINIGK